MNKELTEAEISLIWAALTEIVKRQDACAAALPAAGIPSLSAALRQEISERAIINNL